MTRWQRLAALALGWALCLLLSGCQRRLPGPADCERVAALLLGIGHREMLRVPAIKQRFDAVVVDCLTTPYDRQLVQCLEETGRSRQCALEFRKRQVERLPNGEATEPLPRRPPALQEERPGLGL